MKTLLLIDANSLIHRTFHALPPFTASDGQPTGALYGLSSILLKINQTRPPDFAAVAFDRPEPTFRKKIFKAYKAQRPPAPEALIKQIIEAHNLFSKFGFLIFEEPGFEADDIIATIVKKFKNSKELKIIILTGDLDSLQLIEGEKIIVETPQKGISKTVIYNEEKVRERYGIDPKQIPDYKALVGDPSDNIPGLKGLGPKSAQKIIKNYGAVENVYKKNKLPTPTVKFVGTEKNDQLIEKLKSFKEDVLFFKKLTTLNQKIPIKINNLEGLTYKKSNPKELVNYFQKLGFQSLIKRIQNNNQNLSLL